MICRCTVCGREYEYDDENGYDKKICGPFCDGKHTVLRTIEELVDLRNDFEGPSLDYMQGYRDGQQFIQNELRVVMARFYPKAGGDE